MLTKTQLDRGVSKAVQIFWNTRLLQIQKQQAQGKADQGSRGAVTGGKQMDGFVDLIRRVIIKSGIPEKCIFIDERLELPGFFRAEKKWDLVVVDDGQLLASVEFKSQIGPSFGNNFNNRTEEAIGTAQDLWTAFREGAFKTSQRPWLGYLFVLEDCEASRSPVKVKQPHFSVFQEFRVASYADRYNHLLSRLVRERLYDATCLLLSSAQDGVKGKCEAIDPELNLLQFVSRLHGHLIGYLANKS